MGFDLQNHNQAFFGRFNIKFWKTQRKFENSKFKIANLKKKLHVNTSKTKHLCGHSYLCARIISDGIP